MRSHSVTGFADTGGLVNRREATTITPNNQGSRPASRTRNRRSDSYPRTMRNSNTVNDILSLKATGDLGAGVTSLGNTFDTRL